MINCKYCYFNDMCHCDCGCDNYTPISDMGEETLIDEIIELGRTEFLSEWNQYINED